MNTSEERIAELTAQVDELRETLAALAGQSLDAVMVPDAGKGRVFAAEDTEQPYRALVETMNEGAATVTTEGILVYANRRLTEMLGVPLHRLLGESLADRFSAQDQNRFRQILRGSTPPSRVSTELTLMALPGKTLPVLVSYSGTGPSRTGNYDIILTDLTERKKAEADQIQMERQLLETQKLESLGLLAGGIAHDFNNILASILAHTELAQLRAGAGASVDDNLQRIKEATSRAAELTRQMLAYTGRAQFRVAQVDLNHLLIEMKQLLEVSISKTVTLQLDLEAGLPPVSGDVSQLHQVIMNLVINASEAIGDSQGRVVLSTSRLQPSEQFPAGIQIQVSDTGCGMTSETLAKVFDPFFTTKFTGRGLGMAAVHGILKAHHGDIQVESQPGLGTRFTVSLPAAEPLPSPASVPASGTWHRTGTILLVDDEEPVRLVGAELLRELGLRVLVAEDGLAALEVLKDAPDVSTMILDLTMPRMSGDQTFREVRRRFPRVQVIICSGYPEDDVCLRFADVPPDGYLEKPYDLPRLQAALSALAPAQVTDQM